VLEPPVLLPLLLPLVPALPPSSLKADFDPVVIPPQATGARAPPVGAPTATTNANSFPSLGVVTPRIPKSYAPDRLCTRLPLV
jgi:hypothetical protein